MSSRSSGVKEEKEREREVNEKEKRENKANEYFLTLKERQRLSSVDVLTRERKREREI
jgi:hypothetical protein